MKLYSRIRGEGDPLILLHGLFGDADNLAKLANSLSDVTQVHCLDVRNHGRSPHCSSMCYDEMAQDVLHYLDNNQIQSCSILGHSMGGKIAMQTALSAPERINKLVVADIAPVNYSPHHDEIFKGLKSVLAESPSSRKEADVILAQHIDEPNIRQFLLKSLYRDNNGKYDWRFNLDVIIQEYDTILSGQSAQHAFSKDVLFIAGGDSDYVQSAHKAQILSLFPNVRLKVIPGTGHWLHAEKPEVFNALVRRFLVS